MHVEQKRFAVLDEAVGVLEVGLALADGLDLGAAQGHAGFEPLQQEVVVAGGAVVRGVALAGGDGVARPDRFLGAGSVRRNDDVAGLASHREASSNLHPNIGVVLGIGAGFPRVPLRLC